MNNLNMLLVIAGTAATIFGVALTWLIAKKQGVFDRSDVRASLYDLLEKNNQQPELIIGGPHLNHNILTPILVKIANFGTATAHDIEISLESNSSLVVNHPKFFISPIATDSAEAIEGRPIYLGKSLFRRVFKINQLNPGKSIQLNNAGLPRNFVSENRPAASSVLSVKIYEKGKSVRECKFSVWSLDTTNNCFKNGLYIIAKQLKMKYKSKSTFQRIGMRLRSHRFTRSLQMMEIKTLRKIPVEEEAIFQTIDKVDISFGVIFPGGELVAGPIGLIPIR